MEKTNEEGGLIPRPPANDSNNSPPYHPPSRRTDNGDDKERQPPHSSSKILLADEIQNTTKTGAVTVSLLRLAEPLSVMASTEETPTAVLPQLDPPCEKNPREAEAGSQENLNPGGQGSQRQDDRDGVSSSMILLPGAVPVGAMASRSGRLSTSQTSSEVDARTQLEPQIVAFLAPNDEVQIEARVAQRAQELLRQQLDEVMLADEVKNDDSSIYCRLKKRTLLLLGILSLLLIIGGAVGGVLSSSAGASIVSTPAPTFDDPLWDELRSLNATYDEDLLLFSDPMSPQSKALAWMKNDTIVMSPGRSTQDVLQRYSLAVLFYATSGPTWGNNWFYLTGDDVCSWYGVSCGLDGESVDGLDMFDNSLQGQLPSELWLLTSLQIINLGTNKLIGSIPPELDQLLSLKSLDIRNSQLTSTIPAALGQLRSLVSIEIGSNQLTGTIPTEFGQLLSLQSLDITSNLLTGKIPTELGQLLSFEKLAMYYNQLTGTIPTELGQLVSLTYLSIEFNQLTGTIPTELGQLLVVWKGLTLGSNQLTGTIPTELGQLLSSQWLYMWGNQLTGTIPTELGQLQSLEVLFLYSNQLTGAIPTELTGIASLSKAHFYGNALTGSLEQMLCVDRPQPFWVVDCDKVECSCCGCT